MRSVEFRDGKWKQTAVQVFFFKLDILSLPQFFLGRKFTCQRLTYQIFSGYFKEGGGPWMISFPKKNHLCTLFKTSFSFILYHSLQYHLNSTFHFSLGPMFLSAFLRDWGVISFDILTVTVMTTGSWSQLSAKHSKLFCH